VIEVKILLVGEDEELEFLAEYVQVRDVTGDDSLRLRADGPTIKLDTAPM
jgi:hypothetical protein